MVILHIINFGKPDIPLICLANGLFISLGIDQIDQTRRPIQCHLLPHVHLDSMDLVGPLHNLHVRFIPQIVDLGPKDGDAATSLDEDGTRPIRVSDDLFGLVVIGDVSIAIDTPNKVACTSTEA